MNALLVNSENRPTALIAEDEPHLAIALKNELARIWPELHVIAIVGDGLSAVRKTLALKPDILFFDIRMPGLSGLDAAAELADCMGRNVFSPRWYLLRLTTNTRYKRLMHMQWTICSNPCNRIVCNKPL